MDAKEAWSDRTCPTTAESTSSSEVMMNIKSTSFHEIRSILIIPSHEESLDEEITLVLRREARERRDEKFEKAQIERQGVTFTNIIIRDYPMTVGDNPSVSSGPPLTIGWNYFNEVTIPLDIYEDSKPSPRNGREMIVPRMRREQIFRDAGFTYNQLIKLTKPVNIARIQRHKTYASLGLSPWIEVYEKATRKARNVISLGKKKRKEKAFLKPWIEQSVPSERYCDVSMSKRTDSLTDPLDFEPMPESVLIQG